MHARRNSDGDTELDHWGTPMSMSYKKLGYHFTFNTELEFQAEALAEGGFGVSSPPLWKSYRARSFQTESSPLLPRNHHYSNLSPISRRRAIVDGRRELMEMIENMPESSYELSLKDIVDVPQSLQENEEEKSAINEEHSNFKAESEIMKQKMDDRNVKRAPITRIASMESEAYLIKMFFPTSLVSKKKVKPESSARIPFLKSPTWPKNGKEKVRWIKCLFVSGRSRSISRSSTSGSNSSSNSSSTRYGSEANFVPGCWSFFPSKKSRSMRD